MSVVGVVIGATLLSGCAGPFGFRVGLNPAVVKQLANDPAAWCIVVEAGRVVYWRDNAENRLPTTPRECLDPRSVPPGPPR